MKHYIDERLVSRRVWRARTGFKGKYYWMVVGYILISGQSLWRQGVAFTVRQEG